MVKYSSCKMEEAAFVAPWESFIATDINQLELCLNTVEPEWSVVAEGVSCGESHGALAVI